MDYERLKDLYEFSEIVCDPINYIHRKKSLLSGVVEYILERDKPKEDINSEEDNPFKAFVNDK